MYKDSEYYFILTNLPYVYILLFGNKNSKEIKGCFLKEYSFVQNRRGQNGSFRKNSIYKGAQNR